MWPSTNERKANMHENRKDVKMAVSASDAISASGTGRVRTVWSLGFGNLSLRVNDNDLYILKRKVKQPTFPRQILYTSYEIDRNSTMSSLSNHLGMLGTLLVLVCLTIVHLISVLFFVTDLFHLREPWAVFACTVISKRIIETSHNHTRRRWQNKNWPTKNWRLMQSHQLILNKRDNWLNIYCTSSIDPVHYTQKIYILYSLGIAKTLY